MSENTKRLLTLVMAVSMVLSMMPISVSAQEQTVGTPVVEQEVTETLPEIEAEATNLADAVFTPETARPLTLGVWDDVRMADVEQKAYFSFTPEQDGIYIMHTDVEGVIDVVLQDAEGNVLNESRSGNYLGNDALVYNTLTAGQTYYFVISYAYDYYDIGTIAVVLSYSTLVDLQFGSLELIENINGWWQEDEQGSYYYYEPNYFLYGPEFTATFSDGTVITGRDAGFTYNDLHYGIWGYTEQSAENLWTVGNTYTIEVSCMGRTFQIPVTIVPSPLVELTFTPITIIENTCGYTSTYWDEETESEKKYFYYSDWQLLDNTTYTAQMADGSVLTGNGSDLEYMGQTYSFNYGTMQGNGEVWTAGNTYAMTVSVMGKTVEVPVTIAPNPLVSLNFDPIYVTEYSLGYTSSYCDEETGNEVEYFYYPMYDLLEKTNYTAQMLDGSVLTGSGSSFEYMGQTYSFNCGSMQGNGEVWTVGNTYTMTVHVMGRTVEVPVTIMPSPLVSLEFSPVSVTENTHGNFYNQWNEETGEYDLEYYGYHTDELLEMSTFTATFNDGTVVVGNAYDYGLTYNDQWYSFDTSNDQGYYNPWTAGNTYNICVDFMGKEFNLPVTITPSPLVSLEFSPVSVMENTHGGIWSQWNEETEEYDLDYYGYSSEELLDMSTYTATFNDGTVISGNASDRGLTYNDQWYSFAAYHDQSYYNPWTVGNTYQMKVLLIGKECYLPVTITPSPLVSVEFTPVSVLENTHGSIRYQWNEETETEDLPYFSYYVDYLMYMSTFTATFSDGTQISGKGSDWGLTYNDQWYEFSTYNDQGYYNQWTAGNTYDMAVSFMGKEFNLPVTITASPLVSLEFSSVSVMENTHGGFCGQWNEETGEHDLEYYEYYVDELLDMSTFTATFTDGTVISGNASDLGLTYNDQWYTFDIYNEQDYYHQWTVGNTYEMKVEFMGSMFYLPVTIVETPLVSLEFAPVSIMEGTCFSLGQNYNPETGTYEAPVAIYEIWEILNNSTFTATFADGTVITGSGADNGLEYNGQWYEFEMVADQSQNNRWTAGNTYYAEVTCMNKTAQLPITITQSPVVSITAEPITIIENTCGYMNSHWSGDAYYYYSVWNLLYKANATLVFADGAQVRITSSNTEYNGETYWLSYACIQDYDHQWKAGNTYSLYLYVAGKMVEIPVTIVSSPLVSLAFDSVSVPENSCGYYDTDWNEETGEWDLSYFRYDEWDMLLQSSFTATFNDGTVVAGSAEEGGLYYNGQWYEFGYSSNQDYYNQWTLGNTYDVTVSLMGVDTLMPVTIVASPLVSLEFKPISLMEEECGYYDYSWNEETEDWDLVFYRYSEWYMLEKSSFTATFSDGTVVTGYGIDRGLSYNGQWYSFDYYSDQSYYNQWLPGNTYAATIELMGMEVPLSVTILASPLTSLTFAPITVTENTCGYLENYFDGMQEQKYYYYSIERLLKNTTYTATFVDGTVITQNANTGFEYDGKYYHWSASYVQGEDNQWTADNTYIIEVAFMGKTVEVPVTIEKSPVVHAEVDAIYLVEGLDDDFSNYYDDMSGSWVEYTYYDWLDKLSYTLTLENGDVLTGNRYGVTYNGQRYGIDYYDNQSADDPWLPGNTYTATLIVMGYMVEVPITICRAEAKDDFSYILQNGKVIITDCYLTDTVIQIPDTIEGYPVVGITSMGAAMEYVEELIIADSVTMLSNSVFDVGYYGRQLPLKKLHLGSGVSTMSVGMLYYCADLEQITVSADNQTFCSVEGVLYNKDCTELVVYPFGKTDLHVIPDTVENIDALFDFYENFKAVNYQLGSGVKDYVEVDGVVYTKDMTELVVCTPKRTGSYVMPESVTTIRNLAFVNSNVTSVKVSSKVTDIAYCAFLGCDQLESIDLPENLKTISMGAFDGCSGLESITIPASVTYIGYYAFKGCEGLTAVYTDSLEAWCGIEFSYSTSNPLKYAKNLYVDGKLVEDLVIPSTTSIVYAYAFYNANLKSITVPSCVYTIGNNAFYDTTATTLQLAEGLRSIEYEAFAESDVQSVTLPDSLQYLAGKVFYGCQDLEAVTIGSGLVVIESRTFENTGLKSVVLPENIEYVGYYAFANSSLTEVTFNCNSVYIGERAFMNCPLGDLDLKENIQGIDWWAFCGTMATKVSIPNTITGLTYREFAFSYNLVSVTLPDSLEYIGSESFRGDSNLSHVLYTGTAEQWDATSIDSPEILNATIHFEAKGDEVTTQQTCTQIKFYCSICKKWETVNKVKANHNMVDDVCTVCGHVGDWEYEIDEKAGTVTITGYSGTAQELNMPETIAGLPVTAIGPKAFAGVANIYRVILPDSLEVIGVSAFENSPHLYDVEFGENLKVIDDFAFKGCERLNKAILPQGLEVIGNNAFASCYWMNELSIPNSVTSIGDYAFSDCYHVDEIVLPEGLTRIGDYTFYSTLIQYIDIPETVTEIGYGAFSWCENLEYVIIPSSVTSISDYAFSENFSLYAVAFMGDAPEIASTAFSGVCAVVFYDADNKTWTEDVLNGYNGELEWCGCVTPRIAKQLKDVYVDETGLASVGFDCTGYISEVYWYGAMPGEEFEQIGCDTLEFEMLIDETNSGYQIYAEAVDILGRVATTRIATLKLAPEMTGIQITKLPNKVEYDLNQSLRTAGMVVMANYSDGTMMEITDYQVSGYRADQIGEQTITVTCGNFTATYTVTVKFEAQHLTDAQQGVEVSAPAGVLESGTELVVETIDIFEELPEVPAVLAENVAVVFDVTLQMDGQLVQPNGEVEVSIPVPMDMIGVGCKVFHVDDYGVASDMNARYEDGYMVFTTSHFSYYAIVQMPGVYVTGKLLNAETAQVNLKQNDNVVRTTYAEYGIYCFECVLSGVYTLEIIVDGEVVYTTKITVRDQDLVVDMLGAIPGDFNEDQEVNNLDVIYLLWHTMFPESYPVVGNADFTGDGEVNNLDVIHLLWHTLFPESYPLV